MRTFQTGERNFGGVRFNILPPPREYRRTEEYMRNPGNLPDKVAIPMGRKADTLFFLHACGWTPSDKTEAFRYVIHYKDGRNETLSVTGREPGGLVGGSGAAFSQGGEDPDDGGGNGVERRNGVAACTGWSGASLDRRAVEIQSIEFIGSGKCVPILLGITGVMEW